jgi:hypothetical protein
LDEWEVDSGLIFFVFTYKSTGSNVFRCVKAIYEDWIGKLKTGTMESVVKITEIGIIVIIGLVI